MLVDEFLPVYDVSDAVATVVEADVATTDEQARKWFRRYWTLGVGPGAHIAVSGVLDLTREMAEAQTATDP